ncbi:hypothetical protein SteCoe_39179 [Stentor coeruleus]|uniref:Uncharacterized protein n=1 Tax=Stentor coeruleus TaxID=5963 RepID=A0A1R2AKV7_9CILI|nr:hypothetical protein SteCoe_39179 [Stentor coeruleus]
MKYFCSILILLSVCSSSLVTENAQQQVGSSCLPNPSFAISSFQASPWPPAKYEYLALNMTGTFQQSFDVSSISFRIKLNNNWGDYEYVVNENFNQGSTISLTFYSYSGSQSGNYLQEIFLMSTSGQILSCWQFIYAIS